MLRTYWYTETLMMMFLSILGTIPDHGGFVPRVGAVTLSGVLSTTLTLLEQDKGSATPRVL